MKMGKKTWNFWSAPKIKYLLQLRSVSFCCPIVPVVLEAATDGERLELLHEHGGSQPFMKLHLARCVVCPWAATRRWSSSAMALFQCVFREILPQGAWHYRRDKMFLFFWRHGLGDKFCRPGGPGSTRQIGIEALQSFTWTSQECLVRYIVKSIDIESHPAAGKPGFCPRISNLIAWTFLANKNRLGEGSWVQAGTPHQPVSHPITMQSGVLCNPAVPRDRSYVSVSPEDFAGKIYIDDWFRPFKRGDLLVPGII